MKSRPELFFCYAVQCLKLDIGRFFTDAKRTFPALVKPHHAPHIPWAHHEEDTQQYDTGDAQDNPGSPN